MPSVLPAQLNRLHPACPMEFYFCVYSIGVKFTPVTAKFTPLNPQRQFNWGAFHWGPLPGCSTGVPSVICLLPCDNRPPPSVIRPLSSVIRPPPSVFRPLISVLCLLSSDNRHLSSAFCHLPSAYPISQIQNPILPAHFLPINSVLLFKIF